MYFINQPMSERLISANMALSEALENEEIKERFNLVVYEESRLNEGLDLYREAEKYFQIQKQEYSEQYQATEMLYDRWGYARGILMIHRSVAKTVFADQSHILNMLGLDHAEKYTLAEWILAGRHFYRTTLDREEISGPLIEYTLTAENLEAGMALVDEVETLNQEQEKEKAEAKEATRQRDEAFAALDKYMILFNKVSLILFSDRPELLNKMGLMLPKRRKNKNGGEPAPGGENQPPAAEFNFTGDGLMVTFAGSGSDADGNIVSYAWDFGDGNNSMEQNPVHTYETNGNYTVSLTVADDGGETGTASQTVEV